MIRYALTCDAGHEFEGWFSVSGDFDTQRERGLLSCPVCDSREVAKQIMAPAVAGRRQTEPVTSDPAKRAVMMEMMGQLRRHVETNFDYVGDTLAKEARAIHDGKAEPRGIYGEASPAEVKALAADGVPIAPLPPEPPKKTEVN